MGQLKLDLGGVGLRERKKAAVRLPETIRREAVTRMADAIAALVSGQRQPAKAQTTTDGQSE